jgi:curved DNA-binding protein CbpA
MRSSAGGTDADRRCPRLAPGWETQATALNPTEGFLLSRIDGHTPWAVLRQIGGLLPEEVDLALESWVKTGLVLLDAPEVRRTHEPPRDQRAIDPSLDLDVELQREILAFEARLAQATYHEILGVERGSEPRSVKRAYFQLSKRFHPDRYFRRNIGDHALRLDRIFKHVALAYELLSDPTTRSEIERGMGSEVAPEAGEYRVTDAGRSERIGEAAEAPPGYRTPSRMENLERLRNFFKIPKKMLAERRFRARQFHQAARVSAHEKSWLEAAASARLAIAFDPWNPEYKQHFASIQADVHAVRATELLEQADSANAVADALKLLEEAIHYRPADAALQARAAKLALETGDSEHAQEYAESACELEPEVAEHHLTLSRALRRAGNLKGAKVALAEALKLAPKDKDVLAEQKLLRRA